MKEHIIVDLDNTLALDEWRRPLIKESWEAYFEKCSFDKPNKEVLHFLHMFCITHKIHVMTNRSEDYKHATQLWLNAHDVPHVSLTMRPGHHYQNSREGALVTNSNSKLHMAEDLGLTPDNVFVVLEDMVEMVEHWREAGYNCWQVRNEGKMYHVE